MRDARMYEKDTRLIIAANRYVSQLTKNRGERLLDAINNYEIASRLARGRDDSRSQVWIEKAEILKTSLEQLVDSARKAE